MQCVDESVSIVVIVGQILSRPMIFSQVEPASIDLSLFVLYNTTRTRSN